MRRIYRFILVFVFLIFSASSGSAAIIELFDWAFNIDGTPYESSMGDIEKVSKSIIPEIE